MSEPRTLIDKLWSAHEIVRREDGAALLWVDRHYVHEGSFHAFSQMKARGRSVAEPDLTFGVADHYVPTRGRDRGIANPEIAAMVRNLESNAAESRITVFGLDDPRQGIVHVVGPEQGLTLPGLLIVCGDSHTSTHGAFGAYAFGIGASEVAHVLMTQTLWQKKPKRMRVTVDGSTAPGIAAKDIALAIIARIGADGAQGHAIEFAGSAIRALTMEGRMTLCNMSIEAGGRCGMVAPDATTFAYLKAVPMRRTARTSTPRSKLGRRLRPIADAEFDREVTLDAGAIAPIVTWGTTPDDALADRRCRARSGARTRRHAREISARRARLYGHRSRQQADRHRDRPHLHRLLHQCAHRGSARGRRRTRRPRQQSPGTGLAGLLAGETSGGRRRLDRIFRDAGLEWADSGCSMCVGINGDIVPAGERCASTTNRNFRGRQGPGARTHLMSPAMVAAAAVTGHLADVRPLLAGRESLRSGAWKNSSNSPPRPARCRCPISTPIRSCRRAI